jgi:hypothetical protein
MATGIRCRTGRRAGELLRQIEPQGGDRGGGRGNQGAGTRPMLYRARPQADAGFSPHQAKRALRVATVPREHFEDWVESPTPPTVTALAHERATPRPSPPAAASASANRRPHGPRPG